MTAADLPRIVEINAANVPAVGAADSARLEHIVAESAIAVVGEIDQRVVGFALVLAPGSVYDSINYRWFMERYDDALYLDRVAFDAEWTGRGLGSQLYAHIDRRASQLRRDGRAISALTLEVNVEPPNVASLAFHRKHGFVEVGRLAGHDDITMAMMRKPY